MLIGIDWGGTKIEGVAMEPDGAELMRVREATPRHDYSGCIGVIKTMIEGMEGNLGRRGSVGIGIPGSLEPRSRLGKGASSTWLLGRPVERDLNEALGREIRVENDADCFAASEAVDGRGAGCNVVFAVFLGSGAGAGIAVNGSRAEQQRRRVGTQSASNTRRDRASRRPLLLRKARMHGDLGVRPGVRSGIRKAHRDQTARTGDHRIEAERRSPVDPPLAAIGQSRRAGFGDRGQYNGSGRIRHGRRNVEHRRVLRGPADRASQAHVLDGFPHADTKGRAWRLERSQGRGLAVEIARLAATSNAVGGERQRFLANHALHVGDRLVVEVYAPLGDVS
jgi:hypothetical protein